MTFLGRLRLFNFGQTCLRSRGALRRLAPPPDL
jgi:hypothetical protein